jgi:hypothetical protein
VKRSVSRIPHAPSGIEEEEEEVFYQVCDFVVGHTLAVALVGVALVGNTKRSDQSVLKCPERPQSLLESTNISNMPTRMY